MEEFYIKGTYLDLISRKKEAQPRRFNGAALHETGSFWSAATLQIVTLTQQTLSCGVEHVEGIS